MALRVGLTKLLIALSILGLGACSTGPKVNPAALAKVKTVGILGFELVQQAPKDLEFSIGGSTNDPIDRMAMSKNPVPAKHATSVFEAIRESLKTDLGWSVVAGKVVRQNADYQALTKKQISGWRSLPPVPAGFDVFCSEGIMDYWAWEKLSAHARSELIKSLGVDTALVIRARAKLKESFSLKKLYGGGNYHPQVTLELKLYAANGQDVIWSDQQVVGEPTAEKAGHFAGISKREALNALVVQATENATNHLKPSRDGGS